MRILVITGGFYPESGGPPTSLYHLLPALQARGHTVHVLTQGDPTTSQAPPPYPVTRISRAQPAPARLAAFARAVESEGGWAEVLFVQAQGLPPIPAALWHRRPLVIRLAGDPLWEFAPRRRRAPRARLARLQQQVGLRQAKAVIVPSEHVAALVQGWGVPAEKIHVILNASPPEPDLPPGAEAARAALGLPPEGALLLGVGRLTAVKGFDVLIRALAAIPAPQMAPRLVIIGEGEERDSLAALAESLGVADRVIFLGRRDHRAVITALRACDVFVLSSQAAGLSRVLLEALEEGRPVVATQVGANPDVLADGESGLLVPPDDPAQLAAAISRILADPALAAQLQAGALERGRAFSWETFVDRTEGLLLAAAEGKETP
ncbi:MAG: glycosyltransferase family 4 protein [Anaerolineae bacterium]|nr:glycosyltransferase family 4 protein [Anaerolineae bacterium]